jgi:hypothetical protein
VLFSFANHALDVFLWQAATTGDGDRLLLAGALVLCRNVDNTVGIDVEGDFNLWNASWCWGNSG